MTTYHGNDRRPPRPGPTEDERRAQRQLQSKINHARNGMIWALFAVFVFLVHNASVEGFGSIFDYLMTACAGVLSFWLYHNWQVAEGLADNEDEFFTSQLNFGLKWLYLGFTIWVFIYELFVNSGLTGFMSIITLVLGVGSLYPGWMAVLDIEKTMTGKWGPIIETARQARRRAQDLADKHLH